jgi:hypothetical protein
MTILRPDKSLSIVLLSALLFAAGCKRPVTVQIPDATKPITLTVSPGHARAHGVSVWIRCDIDGVAFISSSGHGTNRLEGRNEVNYRDNYSTNFTLYYAPETVRSGSVSMEYVFH